MTAELASLIEERTGRKPPSDPLVLTDTTEFFRIERDHVLLIDGRHYLVLGNAWEYRFGIDEEQKPWVKVAVELETGAAKILKLVFHEEFTSRFGAFSFRCVRSEEKEGRVLELVRGNADFMQGVTARDEKGNLVRIIDRIQGRSFYAHVQSLDMDHERYFHEVMPPLLGKVRTAVEAICLIHDAGTCHGDIRNDHIFIEQSTGRFRWIDFDLTQEFSDFDVWSLGNILCFTVAGQILTFEDASRIAGSPAALERDDAAVLFGYRVMNLRKLFPYIPRCLNDVLMRFSVGATEPYGSVAEIVHDLDACLSELGQEPRSLHGSGGDH
ncbi:MAG: hypothetical protein JRG91_00870 [Deltaproteobacteria bacterium]|nr:hypothetical protein [Deltaproteobacteria bacterium]